VQRLARHKDYKTTQRYLMAHEGHLAERASLMSSRG
jgi:hypothetical protein